MALLCSRVVPWRKRIWIIALWIYVLTDICGWADGLRSPGVRRAGGQFVTTNRLAESDTSSGSALDYDALLERMNGDFGIRSEVVKAAGEEPEYHGAETLVVPLYIPEGAVPINLARIARSGDPDQADDLAEAPSSDSVLLRRIGTVSGHRPLPPRRTVWRPPKRGHISRLSPIRRSDLVRLQPATTTPQGPPPIVGGFGRRITTLHGGPPIAIRRISPEEMLPPVSDEELEDSGKRAKKNELSKNSQFHNVHTTEATGESSSSTSKTPTSTTITTTSVKPSSTIKFPKRPLPTSSTPKITTAAATTTTATTTTTSTTTTTTTNAPTTTKSTTTRNSSTTLKVTSAVPTEASKFMLNRTTTPKTVPSAARFTPIQPEEVSTIKASETSTQSTGDRRSVLFPKPVESILGNNDPESTTEATTTTSTVKSTTETPSTTARNPQVSLRILRPWRNRSSSTSTTTTTTTTTTAKTPTLTATTPKSSTQGVQPSTVKTPNVRLRTTRRPYIRTTTEKAEYITTQPSINQSLSTTARNISSVPKRVPVIKRRPVTTTTSTTTTTPSTTTTTTTSTTTTTTEATTTTASLKPTTTPTTTEKPTTSDKLTSVWTATARAKASERTSTEATTTTSKRPVVIPQRSSPVRMMLSVGEILRDSRKGENTDVAEETEEVLKTSLTRGSFVTQTPNNSENQKNLPPELSTIDDETIRTTTERTETGRVKDRPTIRISEARKEEENPPVSPSIPEKDENIPELSVIDNIRTTTERTEPNRDREIPFMFSKAKTEEEEENPSIPGTDENKPVLKISDSDEDDNESARKDEKDETIISELPGEEDENKTTLMPTRRLHTRLRPASNPENKDTGERRPGTRPVRRRRPGRPRGTAPPPITRLQDFFKPPKETISYGTTKDDHTTTLKTNPSTKPTVTFSATTFPTPVTSEKSPEQVVIDSLTDIMRDATNNNRGKDKVSNIATNLEALNKKLAEKRIHIIHAEVDGVRIPLGNRTRYRFTTPPAPTTFHPATTFFKGTPISPFSSTTENPPTSLSLPPSGAPDGLLLRIAETEGSLEKDIYTSIKTSFSVHTSKPTDVESETDSENEVQSTTNDSSLTTSKPSERRKSATKPFREESQSPSLSTSMLPSSEDTDDSILMANRTIVDDNPQTPVVGEALPPVRTSLPIGDREKEGEPSGSVPSIFASSTIPASVTTRTRSTTVPITTHRSSIQINLKTKASGTEFVVAGNNSLNRNTTIGSQISNYSAESTSIHPTSHHRPISVLNVQEMTPVTDPVNNSHTAAKELSYDTFSYATIIEDTPPPSEGEKRNSFPNTTTTTTSTTLRPKIEVIPLTKETQDGAFAAAEGNETEDSTEKSTTASTAIYVIGVIGIIPAAGLAFFLARKFLRKTQKALPDSEERAEGFTPVTHHSRKPSHSNTLDVEPSSVEAKNPKYSPWEFPRSKLRLVSILGEGNFGVVWKAEARELCACDGAPGATVLVAVKGVKERAGLKERQDLLKELAIMQQIGQHPNVVTLLGCCTQQEPHYLVMEYVMFGKLLTFLRDHRTRQNYFNFSSDTDALTSKDLTRFACQIATGCDYLQTRGIIHRDLAARNILVDHNKVCKIADFGLARNVKDLGSDIYEQKSRGALPIRWMAPESLYMSIFTHKSDVWSLGILCWEIVTLGSTPYPGMTAREVLRRVREGYRLERPEHCRPEFYHIVTKCWHQDLNKRPTFAELKVEMAQLLDNGQAAYPCIDLENFPEANYYSMHDNEDEKL